MHGGWLHSRVSQAKMAAFRAVARRPNTVMRLTRRVQESFVPSPLVQQICACFGQPVAGNPTQYMMERAFAHHHLDWRYLTLEVAPEHLGDALRGMRAMGFRGGNITKPHKCEVIPFLDGTSEAAGLMGAVNCINRVGDQLIGENTDGKGFVQSLRELVDPAGKRVVLLGAGGAARAIGVELGLAAVSEIHVVNRTAARGEELAQLLSDKVKAASRFSLWEADFEVPPGTDVVINATSIGLFEPEARVPIAIESLQPEMVVADVVFNPPQTRLLREAETRGCRTLDGLGMLVNQGVIGFRIWTEIDPEPTVMREALEEFLGI
jgi:shikimate dehydrogenase